MTTPTPKAAPLVGGGMDTLLEDSCGANKTTPTPRTDALDFAIARKYRQVSDSYMEMLDHARQLERDLAAAQEALRFVERWANHHGVKPCVKPEHALSTIQHYPPILAITRSYVDGKVPETRNPWEELAQAQEARRDAEEAACRRLEMAEACAKGRGLLLERAQRAEALAESYKALLIEAQRECHEDNGLMARIDAALAGKPL